MKKISRRSIVAAILSVAMVIGIAMFVYNYVNDGAAWASFPSNQHIYTNGVIASQRILDRNGVVLYKTSKGKPAYNENKTIRKATLHAVGDTSGNISTSAMHVFTDQLIQYDLLNGVYYHHDNGSDIYLTLDANVCAAALNALDGRSGTVGVYNYKTGQILCMVSAPTFDPKTPPNLSEDNNGAYINRFLSSAYTPGSIFKLVTSAAAIDNMPDLFSRTFTCKGSEKIGNSTVTCLKAHGTFNFKTALADSCNVTYANLATELGRGVLEEYAEKAGFNKGVTVSGISTATGNFGLSGASKSDIAWSGVGQYTDLANPCTYMTYVGAIANGGIPVYPQFLSKVTSENSAASSSYKKNVGSRILSKSTADTLADLMHNNVIQSYGKRNFPGLDLCAKTGTAEVGGGKKPNAWFTGFIRSEEYPLAFIVIVENGGSGIEVAAPVANTVLQAAVKALKASD
ncbi:MAG: penicillin-binding transpeptidase domain-containing protein [Oscillospiraceae bacterium]|nr:penicillin-binding transpeptidase domain-containing protein [Oscillospiraceae bacterium]